MRHNFTVAAIVSVLLAVAALVQGVSGKWLFVGVAVVTVALDTLIRWDGHRLASPTGVHDEAKRGRPTT